MEINWGFPAPWVFGSDFRLAISWPWKSSALSAISANEFSAYARKSCVLSGRLCFSRCQTHTQLPHQIVFKKNKAQQALCGLRRHCERFDGHGEVLLAASVHLPAFSLPPFIFHSSSTRSADVQPLPPVEHFSLDRPPSPQPTSRSRGWVTGKCVSSQLKLSPRQSPKNNRFCPRGTLRE